MREKFHLESDRLLMRAWRAEESDQSVFHHLNSDEDVMTYFPFRRTRQQADEVMQQINQNFDQNGIGWCALALKQTNEIIGFVGLNKINFDSILCGEIEIGWRVLKKHWRKGYASEAANSLLKYGFATKNFPQIFAFASPQNIASTSVMTKIGMNARPDLDFDHPLVPDEFPHLQHLVTYEITKKSWIENQSS